MMLSCSKDEPYLSINQTEVTISETGDSKLFFLEADRSWIATSSETWCSVYPSAGDINNTHTIATIEYNNTFEDRSCTITVTAGGLSKDITINQKGINHTYVQIKKMGTLDLILNQIQKDTITAMTVKGVMNKADFDVMKNEMPKLHYLDLSDVVCEDNKIPDYAFGRKYSSENKNITIFIFPESITLIGEKAFNNCKGITGDLILPKELVKIENDAFRNCSGLTGHLILPDKLTEIENRAFDRCSLLIGNLVLTDKLTKVGSGAFMYCYGLTGDLVFSDELTEIGTGAFAGCSGLTGLKLGSKITEIGWDAFTECTNIFGKVVFPMSLESLGGESFFECRKVDAFQFPHTTPLLASRKMFPNGSTIEVPQEAVETYKSAYHWKDYNIVGY